jgi:DNA-binding response OmpR family regulator
LHSKYEGTGVGLSLTKELLEESHGNITVKSTPGEGSTFEVFIPVDENCYQKNEIVVRKVTRDPDHLISPEEPTLILAEEKEIGSRSNEPIHDDAVKNLILIVEDNPDMNAYIHQHFSKKYKVITAFDGFKGMELAVRHIPDLIITDLMMPGRDGLEMSTLLKNNEKTSHIPIIMLTARASVEDKIEGLETGADDYIPKPFSLHELDVRVKNLIEQRRLLQEKFSRTILLEPDKVPITGTDEKFLLKLTKLIDQNLSSEDLNVVFLGREMGFSRAQLFRKIKGLTGQTVNQLIRTYRLKKAADLIRGHYGSISEIAYAAGFNNLSYFARCFREVFGKLPSEY